MFRWAHPHLRTSRLHIHLAVHYSMCLHTWQVYWGSGVPHTDPLIRDSTPRGTATSPWTPRRARAVSPAPSSPWMYFHWARCIPRPPRTRWTRTRSIRPGSWDRCRCRVRGLFHPPIHRRKCRHRRSRTVRPSFRWRIEVKVFTSRWLLVCRMLKNYSNKKGGWISDRGRRAVMRWCLLEMAEGAHWCECWRWVRGRIAHRRRSRRRSHCRRSWLFYDPLPPVRFTGREREREETGAQSRVRDTQLMTSVSPPSRCTTFNIVSHDSFSQLLWLNSRMIFLSSGLWTISFLFTSDWNFLLIWANCKCFITCVQTVSTIVCSLHNN